MVNVLGDAFGTGIVQHLSQTDLAKSDESSAKNDEKQTVDESRIDIAEEGEN